MTQPLPPINTDPVIVAARNAKAAFTEKVGKIRANQTLAEAYKAQQIATLWQATLAELARYRDNLNTRRQARWDHLQAQIPTGPDIPAKASPVERAQLHQMFQTAVEKVRAASSEELAGIYADAKRFGDDLTARAAFVVANTEGRGDMRKRYVADHPEIAAALAELDELRNPVGGGFITQALGVGVMGQFPEPPEVAIAARDDAHAGATS